MNRRPLHAQSRTMTRSRPVAGPKRSDRELLMNAVKHAKVPAFIASDSMDVVAANQLAEQMYGPVEAGTNYCTAMFRSDGASSCESERTCLITTLIQFRLPRLSVINRNITLGGPKFILMDGYRVATEEFTVVVHTDVDAIVMPFINKNRYTQVDVETMVLENKFFLADDRLHDELRRHC